MSLVCAFDSLSGGMTVLLSSAAHFTPSAVQQLKRQFSAKNVSGQKEASALLSQVTAVLSGSPLPNETRWLDHLVQVVVSVIEYLSNCSSKWSLKSLDIEMSCSNIVSRLLHNKAVQHSSSSIFKPFSFFWFCIRGCLAQKPS